MSSINILEQPSTRSAVELNGFSTQNLTMTLIDGHTHTHSTNGEIDKKIPSFLKALEKISDNNTLDRSGGEISSSSISCVVTLCKVLDNILLEREYNAKTRTIKLGNKLFRERVGCVPGGGEYFVRHCISHRSSRDLAIFSFFMCYLLTINRLAIFLPPFFIDLTSSGPSFGMQLHLY